LSARKPSDFSKHIISPANKFTSNKSENYYNKLGAHSTIETKKENNNLLNFYSHGTGGVDLLGMSPLPSPSGFNENASYFKPKEENFKNVISPIENKPVSIDELNALFDKKAVVQEFKEEQSTIEILKELYKQSFQEEKINQNNKEDLPEMKIEQGKILLAQKPINVTNIDKKIEDTFNNFEFTTKKEKINETPFFEFEDKENINYNNKENISYPTFKNNTITKQQTVLNAQPINNYSQKQNDFFNLFN